MKTAKNIVLCLLVLLTASSLNAEDIIRRTQRVNSPDNQGDTMQLSKGMPKPERCLDTQEIDTVLMWAFCPAVNCTTSSFRVSLSIQPTIGPVSPTTSFRYYPGFWPPVIMGRTDIFDDSQLPIPKAFSLSQNYPNPFNPSTIIQYFLQAATTVRLEIFDILGRQVEVIDAGLKPAGSHTVQWNGTGVSSGLYFYRLQAGEYSETKKMLLMK